MRPKTLDHVAFWVEDREPIVERATTQLGMHVIDRQDAFTLIGSDARHGKLTLFAAEGPREQGALKHVAVRVSESPEASGDVDLGEGVHIKVVQGPTEIDYDLDHVALLSPDPERAAAEWTSLGFNAAEPSDAGAPRVEVGGAFVEFHDGHPGDPERPLLNHVAVLVDSAAEHAEEAAQRGILERVVDAANTKAAFVWGPDRVRIEYVEHKPEFSLT